MSIVPSDAYHDDDSERETGDIAISGSVAGVFLLLLGAGFALVALLAYHRLSGGIVIADARPPANSDSAPAGIDAPAGAGGADDIIAPAPDASDGDKAGVVDEPAPETAPAGPVLVPTIKPARPDAPPPAEAERATVAEAALPDDAAEPIIPYSAASPEELFADEPPVDDVAPQTAPPADEPALDEPPATEIASGDEAVRPQAPPAAEPAAIEQADEAPSAAESAPLEDAPAAMDPLSGSHLVQVGSFRSEDEAMAEWRRLERRLADLLAGKAHHIERADLGERGVFHRLRIGPFASVDDARAHCAALKERGQDCLAVRH